MAGYRRGLLLPGSVIAVAGAAGPVGRAVAPALAAAGATPVLLDADPAALARVAAVCGDRGRAARALAVDLTDPRAVADAVRSLTADGGRLDGWVHCPDAGLGAGAAPPDGAPPDSAPPGGATAPGPPRTPPAGRATGDLLNLPPDAVVRVLGDAVLGALHGARAAAPVMAERGGGVLVVVASLHGQVARPHAAPPGVAGAALRVLAAALRQELRAGGGSGPGGSGTGGVAVTTVLVPEPDPSVPAFLRFRPERVAATVLAALRRPRLEKVAGGPLAKAVVHGHALVPGATEWIMARATRPPAAGTGRDSARGG